MIVAPPHTGHHDHFSAYSRYLTGIGGFSFEVGAVFPQDGEVTAVTVPDVAPQNGARSRIGSSTSAPAAAPLATG